MERTDLQFFGRIMANVSHEFNNVITIIGELSGLLRDLAGLAERGRPLPRGQAGADNSENQPACRAGQRAHLQHEPVLPWGGQGNSFV